VNEAKGKNFTLDIYCILYIYFPDRHVIFKENYSIYITRLSIDETTVAYSCLSKKIGKSSLGKIQVATTR